MTRKRYRDESHEYRDGASFVAREARWTFFRILPLVIVALMLLGALGFGAKSLGLIGYTAVEAEVFKQSYQRSSALEERIAINEAAIVEIEGKLLNPNLDADTRFNLNAQLSAARVRIDTARRIR